MTRYAARANSAYTKVMIGSALKGMEGSSAPMMRGLDESVWRPFIAELDAWQAEGRSAAFWWRDDDAARPGPALDKLLEIAGTTPLALAVIPAAVHDSLERCLLDHGRQGGAVRVLQHGYAHRNHAPPADKKAEFGAHRRLDAMLPELAAGRDRLAGLFGPLFAPVLVPPWNRVDGSLVARLAEAGLCGVSGYGPRKTRGAAYEVNAHIDIIDWCGNRCFAGESAALGLAVAHLAARRTGKADPDEPTGLLTHHRDHDADCWAFAASLRQAVDTHPAARWTPGAAQIGGDDA